jgi:hypothetical protein
MNDKIKALQATLEPQSLRTGGWWSKWTRHSQVSVPAWTQDTLMADADLPCTLQSAHCFRTRDWFSFRSRRDLGDGLCPRKGKELVQNKPGWGMCLFVLKMTQFYQKFKNNYEHVSCLLINIETSWKEAPAGSQWPSLSWNYGNCIISGFCFFICSTWISYGDYRNI